jgi:hypothetical protein
MHGFPLDGRFGFGSVRAAGEYSLISHSWFGRILYPKLITNVRIHGGRMELGKNGTVLFPNYYY